MHTTLKPIWNIALLVIWAIAAAVFALSASLIPWVSLAAGFLFGSSAGMIQARTLRASKSAFTTATSLMEVRQVLQASTSGKTYLILLWAELILLLFLAIWFYRPDVFGAFAASYCAYAFARELTTLPVIFSLCKAPADHA